MTWEDLAGLAAPVGDLLLSYASLVFVLGYLVLVEVLFPRLGSPRPSWRSRGKALVFWLIYSASGAVLIPVLAQLYAALHIQPLFPSLAPGFLPRPVALALAAVLGAIVGDFFYYWCHRFEHRFLWRFHATHHAVREMSAVTAYHHVAEPLMKAVLYLLPVSLFTHDPYGAPVIGALMGLQGHYLHSTTRLNFGPLGRLIQDNRFHRIHHSIRPEHHDKNFGVVTTLWDHLFGTAYVPRGDEWPETGVADFPEPASVGEYLLGPFIWSPARAPTAAEGQPA